MKNTADITIYHKTQSGYIRRIYSRCFWDEDLMSRISKTGQTNTDSLYISIPLRNAPTLEIATSKDLVVKGIVYDEIDSSTERTEHMTLTQLKKNHPVFTINKVSLKDHGTSRMHHWELYGK